MEGRFHICFHARTSTTALLILSDVDYDYTYDTTSLI